MILNQICRDVYLVDLVIHLRFGSAIVIQNAIKDIFVI